MTLEYENWDSVVGDEMELESDGQGYTAYHPGLDESIRILTENWNPTVAAAYLLETEFEVDTDYGIARLLQVESDLMDKGFVDEEGEVTIELPEEMERLCSDDTSMYASDFEFGENYDERASEVARVIDGLGKSSVRSEEIAEYTDLTPSQVADTLRGIEREEDIKGELGRTVNGKKKWDVEKLGFSTDIVVELEK